MRRELTRDALRELMEELSRTAPAGESFRVYLVGGGTAVLPGWRSATVDADLYAEREEVFRDIQAAGISRNRRPESGGIRTPEARSLLEQLHAEADQGAAISAWLAVVHEALSEKPEALNQRRL